MGKWQAAYTHPSKEITVVTNGEITVTATGDTEKKAFKALKEYLPHIEMEDVTFIPLQKEED